MDETNTVAHIEAPNLVPLLRTIIGPQCHVAQAECSRVIHRIVGGRPVTWGVIDGGARDFGNG